VQVGIEVISENKLNDSGKTKGSRDHMRINSVGAGMTASPGRNHDAQALE